LSCGVNARRYLVQASTVWRGPVEAAAIGGGIALTITVRATAVTWFREPPHFVVAYIGFYVTAAALAGLVVGLVLAGTALLVLTFGHMFPSPSSAAPTSTAAVITAPRR
jgi:hypothetical protein